MENRTINLSSQNHPIVMEIVEMAAKERRTLSNMTALLLEEAIEKRKSDSDERSKKYK